MASDSRAAAEASRPPVRPCRVPLPPRRPFRRPFRPPALLLAAALGGAALGGAVPAQEPTTAAPAPEAAPPAEAPAPPPRRTAADCTGALGRLRERAPAGFHCVIEPPFVVAGEGGPEIVRRHAERTVRWAVRLLRQDFFDRDPDEVLAIWLFDGDRSYRKHARQLFGDQPTTPYGYYSSRHRALIMNIATGGGTLVHEIVHPFVEANVPDCPAWINEGLGSLFEQCRERGGHIEGMVNWRLDGLQDAIRGGRTRPLAALLATTDAEFYGAGSGLHYAMSRYLLLWLQEQGRLRAFWRDWLEHREADPSGAAALGRALGAADLAAFQAEWHTWALRLR